MQRDVRGYCYPHITDSKLNQQDRESKSTWLFTVHNLGLNNRFLKLHKVALTMFKTIFPYTSAVSENGQNNSDQQKSEKGKQWLATSTVALN